MQVRNRRHTGTCLDQEGLNKEECFKLQQLSSYKNPNESFLRGFFLLFRKEEFLVKRKE